MMSQNRKEERDRQRARSDYLINLKAEIGGTHGSPPENLDLLISEQMQTLFEIQKVQMEMMGRNKKCSKESVIMLPIKEGKRHIYVFKS